MVTYYLKMQPHLFRDAVDEQFRRLQEEKEQAAKAAQEQREQTEKERNDKPNGEEKGLEVTLYRSANLLLCMKWQLHSITCSAAPSDKQCVWQANACGKMSAYASCWQQILRFVMHAALAPSWHIMPKMYSNHSLSFAHSPCLLSAVSSMSVNWASMIHIAWQVLLSKRPYTVIACSP